MEVENKYKHLVQKPELCFATVLAMVGLRRGIWIDEEEIASELNIKITKDVEDCYNNDFRVADGIEDAGYGIKHLDLTKVNEILEDYQVPVKAKYIRISEIENVERFLVENIDQDNDVAILFSLKAMGFHERSWYHWSLVSSYNTKTKEVMVCDPEETHKSYWRSSLKEFLGAMSDKWDGKERGFMIFESKEENEK